jgi:hypothetical protein
MHDVSIIRLTPSVDNSICPSIYAFWYLRPVLTLTCLKGVMFSVQEIKQRFNINYYATLLSTEGVSLIILTSCMKNHTPLDGMWLRLIMDNISLGKQTSRNDSTH